MLLPIQLVLALLQADPVDAPTGDRLIRSTVISSTVISSTSTDREVRLPINIGPTHYHPTVAYVPYQGPSARAPQSKPIAAAPPKPIVYDLVVHSPAPQTQVIPHRQVHVVAKFSGSSSSIAASTPPRLRSAVQIPVPDDLTLIQPQAIPVTPRSHTALAVKTKTSIPRIERILGIDTSNLPITPACDDCRANAEETRQAPVASDEIPVPTLGS